jgi:sulfur transfer protein SufE
MDAKTIHGLVWLAALSLFCATTAWTVGHVVFAAVFAALTVVAVLGAARCTGVKSEAEED